MKRILATIAVPVAVLGLVACGDDDDDSSTDTTSEPTDATSAGDDTVAGTEPDVTLPGGDTLPDISLPDISLPDISLPPGVSLPDISIPDISIPDISVPDVSGIFGQIFPNLSEEQIDCLVENLDVESGRTPDVNEVMNLIEQCDINPADLLPGGGG